MKCLSCDDDSPKRRQILFVSCVVVLHRSNPTMVFARSRWLRRMSWRRSPAVEEMNSPGEVLWGAGFDCSTLPLVATLPLVDEGRDGRFEGSGGGVGYSLSVGGGAMEFIRGGKEGGERLSRRVCYKHEANNAGLVVRLPFVTAMQDDGRD